MTALDPSGKPARAGAPEASPAQAGSAPPGSACAVSGCVKPPPAAGDDARERFFGWLREALDRQTFSKLVLAKPSAGAGDLMRVTVRALGLRGQPHLSFVHSHATRDVTVNLPVAEGLAAIGPLVGGVFAHAHLHTATGEAELRVGKRGRYGLSRRAAQPASDARAAAPAHDRAKHRFVDIGRPWLFDLGVTDAQGRLVPAMARKWKQINRFVEVFDHAWAASALQQHDVVRVVDFGSGKGYLTFALHDHLHRELRKKAEVTGIELRPDLVDLCNRAATRSGLAGLHFVEGDLRTQTPPDVDVMIALHACDTATDHALHLGVRAGARVILCAPCCHKELRPQLRSPELLRPMLQHGIHLDLQAEMVTDSLRALRLEAEGYATQVFEFVALEHTRKNKMILAVKREVGIVERAALEAQIGAIKSFYGIREHCLERLLGGGPGRS